MLSIATVCYNPLEIMKQCIEAVLKNTTGDFEYILVNNHPPYEGVTEYLKKIEKENESVILIDPGENVGCHEGYNLAFAKAKGDFIVKLDDDTILPEDKQWAQKMIKAFEEEWQLAYLSADIDTAKQNNKYRKVDYGNGIILEIPETGIVGFACVMFPEKIIDKFGKFKGTGLYGREDQYYSLLAKKNGLIIAHFPPVKVKHIGKSYDSDSKDLYAQWKYDYGYLQITNIPFDEFSSRSKKAKVSIVIPVYNQLEYTMMCIESIKKHTPDDLYEFVFIDNGSTDGTKEYLATLEKTTVITNQINRGVAPAWNQGIRASAGDYIAILNNDIIVPPKWLENLISVLEKNPEIYYASPLYERLEMAPDYEKRAAELAEKEPEIGPDHFIGFCFVMKRQTIREIGLFDEQFEMGWYEDTDYQARLKKAGHPPVGISNVLIHHFESKTLWTIPDMYAHTVRNAERYRRKWQNPDAIKIIIYVADKQGCGIYRVLQPARLLNETGLAFVDVRDSYEDEPPLDTDLFIFQRQASDLAVEVLRWAKRLGKKTVYEIDDQVLKVPPSNSGYEYYKDPEKRRNIETMMSEVDAIIVSTENLKGEFSKYNKNIYVIPNYLDNCYIPTPPLNSPLTEGGHRGVEPLPPPFNKGHLEPPFNKGGQGGLPNELVVGWAGGGQHYDDLMLLKGVVETILDEFKNVKFAMIGCDPMFFKVPDEKKISVPWTNDYQQFVKNLLIIDIGLAPIADIIFNQCKSDLKLLEYGILGIPVIASYTGPYIRAIDEGYVLKAKNPKDWIKQIRKLVNDEDARKEWGEKAKEYTKDRILQDHIEERLEIYKEIIGRRE
ncbi:MAG: glycosyltransferase [Actinobacteria bacterium]|nr:glycosyltransferase [Actinomycetota bacterium]